VAKRGERRQSQFLGSSRNQAKWRLLEEDGEASRGNRTQEVVLTFAFSGESLVSPTAAGDTQACCSRPPRLLGKPSALSASRAAPGPLAKCDKTQPRRTEQSQ